MNIQELATCADLGLPVKIFIMNNGYLGMVRQLQEKRFDGRYSETAISNPDFLKLAESYGLKALRITQKNELKKAIDAKLDGKKIKTKKKSNKKQVTDLMKALEKSLKK